MACGKKAGSIVGPAAGGNGFSLARYAVGEAIGSQALYNTADLEVSDEENAEALNFFAGGAPLYNGVGKALIRCTGMPL
jgi:hypothetical protein